MKATRVRSQATLAVYESCGWLAACLVVLAGSGVDATLGWFTAAGLLVVVPLGVARGMRQVSRLYTAPPSPPGLSDRRFSLFSSVTVRFLILVVPVVATPALFRAASGEPAAPLAGPYAAVPLILLVPEIVRAIMVRLAVADVERRWPVELFERPPGRLGVYDPLEVVALHASPQPVLQRPELPVHRP